MGISKDSQLYQKLQLGDDPQNPIGTENGKKTRSEFRFSLIFELANRGLEHDEIAGIMLNPELGLSKSYLDRKGGDPQKLAIFEAQKAILKIADNWPELTKDGRPKMGFMNAMFGVARMGLTFSNNIFQNRKQAGGRQLQEFQGDLSDDGMAMLRNLFVEMFGFDVGKGHLFDAVQVHCVENSYHPVRDYLNGLEHDGVSRLETFFIDYMEAEDTPLNRAIAKLMFVAAVRRIRQPGCKFDEMVVVEGEQGTGKSTAFKILAGEENFTDQNIFAMDSKAQAEIIEGNWIVEVAELSGLRHADINSVKATLSRSEDQIRPAYARFKERWPRQCIFVGTTNEDTYLKDETGNRRFLPVKTGQIDLESIKLDRDQLWAEAAELEADGFSIQLPPALWADAKDAQDTRMPPDPWEDKLSELSGISIENGFERISSVDIFNTENLNISGGNQKDYHAKHAAKVMRKLGWDGPKAIRINRKTKRGYERPISLSDGGSDDVPY
jgi:predicted P-loop ATPase